MNATKEEFVRLWTSAQPGVAAFISAMVPDYHAAEDVLQECAAVLLQKFNQYDSTRPFLSWAIGIARTEVFSRRRRFLIERLIFNEAALDSIASAYDGNWDEVDDRLRFLRRCAGKVHGRSRNLLALRYGQNLKPRDIARQIGLTPNATTVALARIREALRKCIERLLAHDRSDDMEDMTSLTDAFIDENLTPEAAIMLCDAVIENTDHAKSVVRELLFHRRLYDIFHGESILLLEGSDDAELNPDWRCESVALPAITEDVDPMPEEPEFTPDITPYPIQPKGTSKWWKGFAAAAILAVGVTTAIVLHRKPMVATLTNAVDATWEDGSSKAIPTQLSAGDQLSLKTGFCALQFLDGTRVIVEGPARFTMQAIDKISLAEGKLDATMTGGKKGFIVQTPSTTITDLGTEFGVDVNKSNGKTEVDVFKGAVTVAASDQQTSPSSRVAAGDAAIVQNKMVQVTPAGSMPQRFVHDLPKAAMSLDVADLISGGDGTTHRRGGMINPLAGRAGTMQPAGDFAGDSTYHAVPSLPVIDGCFIPNGETGPVQIDSLGHLFPLSATDGKTYDLIFGGNDIPVDTTKFSHVQTAVGGVDYSQSDHWLLYLHANVGLTFDLAAIKRLHPGLAPAHFRGILANPFQTRAEARKNGLNEIYSVDSYFLVDGKLRLQQTFLNKGGTISADVPLSNADRFLTIVATDHGEGHHGHDVLLGDPAFEMH